MELRQVDGLFKPVWQNRPLDEWSTRLKEVCGNFRPVPCKGRDRVLGLVDTRHAGGVDFAHVVKDLARVERGPDDIRRDANEHLFLIIQLGGVGKMEQSGRQSILRRGDCVLIDSARPSEFVFDGLFSNQLSVHLPRQIMYSASPVRFMVSTKLDRRDPMATTIRSLIAKMMLRESANRSNVHMCSLLMDTTRLAFEFDDGADVLPRLSGPLQRIEYIDLLIDRNLVNPDLSPSWLARKLNQPLRRLQEDYQAVGSTLSSVIREKRLKLAAQRLAMSRASGARMSISDVAYSCGFNDVSYFNRCFRKAYSVAPSEFVSCSTELGDRNTDQCAALAPPAD